MDLQLKDKVALVGGASRGLGKACAEALAQEGARIAICSRTEADLNLTAEEIRQATGSEVMVYAGDLDKHEAIRKVVSATVENFGGLDILVNNSGGPPLGRAATADEELWNTAVQRSLLFFARICREAIPHLKKRGGGRIINLLSSSVYNPIDNLALSGATRMGVVAFSKSLADEVGRDNILVNNVCPGYILTDRMRHYGASRAETQGVTFEEGLKLWGAETALGRIGRPEELAALVAFLASERASYITGTTMLVDGGLVRSVL
ncbi:MAG: SDR family oxidoreductase [Dehalococcoidia bacterium]